MKKLITLACAALASTFLFAASPATGVDVSLPGTHTVVFKINSTSVKNTKKVLALGFTFYIEGEHPASEVYIDDITLWSKK